MSDLVDFEDLDLLDDGDLRAVFGQVAASQVIEALAGAPDDLRRRLMAKLAPASAAGLQAQIMAHGPIAFEAVRTAQRALVEVLCRLARSGQVAFDDPEDMVA